MDRNTSFMPISIATQMTKLTPRQIRYYEQQGLIQPMRTDGKKRFFSLAEVDRLLEIKELMDKGMNIAGVKACLSSQPSVPTKQKEMTEEELRSILKQELFHPRRTGLPHLMSGDLSRFF